MAASQRLAGRVAIVTGASRGLGRAIALALAAEGAAVAVAARTQEATDDRLPGTVHDTAQAIAERGGSAVAVPCDVTNQDDLARLVNVCRDRLGPISLLINNAALTVPPRRAVRAAPAVSTGPSILSFPATGFRRHFDVGVFAASAPHPAGRARSHGHPRCDREHQLRRVT